MEPRSLRRGQPPLGRGNGAGRPPPPMPSPPSSRLSGQFGSGPRSRADILRRSLKEPLSPSGPPSGGASPVPKKGPPKCKGCGEPISGQAFNANGHYYHPEHFRCCTCGIQLQQFCQRDGKVYCKADHDRLFGIKCKACGAIIEGKALQAQGAHYHPNCYTCTTCRQPLTSGAEVDGKPYCRKHYLEQFGERCACGCGKPLEEERISTQGKSYIPGHLRCAHCSLPLKGRFMTKDGQFYCTKDYGNLFCDQCAVCKQSIMNRRYEKNTWGQVMCHAHREKPDTVCHDCGRYLAKGEAMMVEDRAMCKICSSTSVAEDTTAILMLEKVRSAMKTMALVAGDRIPLALAAKEKLHRACKKRGHLHTKSPLGLTRAKIIQHPDGSTQRILKGVLMLRSLSAPLALNVLAHEFGHCYLFIHRFPVLATPVEEGICELFTWAWMNTQPKTEFYEVQREKMLQNPDPTYGEGFRRVYQAFQQRFHGHMLNLLEYVKKNGKLPGDKGSVAVEQQHHQVEGGTKGSTPKLPPVTPPRQKAPLATPHKPNSSGALRRPR